MKKLITLLSFLPFLLNAQTISKPIIMEYQEVNLATNGIIYGYFNSSTPIALPLPGSRLVKDASGGFNRVRAVATDGAGIWTSKQYNESSPMVWTQTTTDTTGATLTGLLNIWAFEDIYIVLAADSSLMYGGDDYFHFFYGSGTSQMRPTPISPAGVKFKKVSIGNAILGLATNGDVYQWTKGNKTAVKITLPKPAIDIAASWYNANFAILQQTSGSLYGKPYVWGNAWGVWGSAVSQNFSTPTDLSSAWNITSLIKRISVDRQATHYIDSLKRLWCPASYNVQGEGGFGVEYVNRETYSTYPGMGWTFADYQNPTTAPGQQVGVGVQWEDIYDNNWYSFYKWAKDINGNVYSCGRNKTNVQYFGQLYNANDNANYPNDFDRSSFTLIPNPFTQVVKVYSRINPVRGMGGNRTITRNSDTLRFTGHMALAVNGTDTTKGKVQSWLYTKVSAPSGDASVIVCPTCPTTAVNNLKTGTYQFKVQVTDEFKGTDTSQVQVIVNLVPNVPPTVNAGVDQTITQPASGVTLSGTASGNSGATISSTLWTLVSAPAGTSPSITSPSNLSTTITGMTIPGAYTYKLTATDSNNNTNNDTVVVTVLPTTDCKCKLPTNIIVI